MDEVDAATFLVVIRGDTASGKSTTAAALRERIGGNTALVQHDYFRWELLYGGAKEARARDAVPMIDSTARAALTAGYSVILEGIFNLRDWAVVLEELQRDHQGVSRCYQFDVGLDETIRRHQGRPLSALFGEAKIREWYDGWQPLPFTNERRLEATQSTEDIVTAKLSVADHQLKDSSDDRPSISLRGPAPEGMRWRLAGPDRGRTPLGRAP
jgi:hypothetical protein